MKPVVSYPEGVDGATFSIIQIFYLLFGNQKGPRFKLSQFL
jgi:hypothetical protein